MNQYYQVLPKCVPHLPLLTIAFKASFLPFTFRLLFTPSLLPPPPLAVPNHDAPHKRTSSPTTSNANLQMCSFSEQSCHFYSHCVESHFHCGPLGFAQAYAEARCEAIDDLHHSSEPCDSCISSGWSLQLGNPPGYLLEAETC